MAICDWPVKYKKQLKLKKSEKNIKKAYKG